MSNVVHDNILFELRIWMQTEIARAFDWMAKSAAAQKEDVPETFSYSHKIIWKMSMPSREE